MGSLTRRLVVAATLVLVACLGLTGSALDVAFRDASFALVKERLQAQVYAVLAAAEMDSSGRLGVAAPPPEPRLSTPASGLYAYMADGTGAVIWRSPSALGKSFSFAKPKSAGVGQFERIVLEDTVFAYVFAVDWEGVDGQASRYTIQIAERSAGYEARLDGFRRTLWGWFALAAVALVAAQGLVLSWGLSPLRQVAAEVNAIELGKQTRLEGVYPAELGPLTRALNALMDVSERRLERHRDGLADLAHSLKTPLAVMRAAVDRNVDELDVRQLKGTVFEQVARMDHAVGYQLQRAAATGRRAIGPPIDVQPLVESLANALRKVYVERNLQLTVSLSDSIQFRGDDGDLMEMLGNVMDNACKWAQSTVEVRAEHPGDYLEFVVEDDGPGIASDEIERLLERGGRADPDVPGQGIGLAVVGQLTREAYNGDLKVERSALGGALVRISLPMPKSTGA
jgi:two-component system, OmpR family, sensor histidine kinase PhoQ